MGVANLTWLYAKIVTNTTICTPHNNEMEYMVFRESYVHFFITPNQLKS
jgi:hypothetical protein